MDNFNDFQFNQIEKEYSKLFTPQIDKYLTTLNLIISNLEINGFKMPLLIQNELHLSLLEVKQILETLSINKQTIPYKHPQSNNPIKLLLDLNTLSQQFNQHSLKSPFYLLLNKSNTIILNCTNKILKYFSKNN